MTKNKFFWLIGIAAITLLLFFFFRLSSLESIPVFVDEAIYVRWSQIMRNEPSLRFIPLSDGKQPLFMWVTMPFLKIISDPLIAGRMVSVIAGLGTLIGIGLLSYILFADIFIAAFSAFLYAIIPFTVFFDRMALADSLLAMFGIWSLYFAVKFAKHKKTEDAIFLGFAIGGGLLTKSPAMVYYAWFLMALVFFSGSVRTKINKVWISLWGIFLSIVISQVMYGILRLGEGFQMIGARNLDYVYPFREVLTHPFTPLIENLKRTSNWLFLLLTPTVLILGGLGWLHKKFSREVLFLILVSLLPLVFQASIAKVYTSRYALFAVVPLIPIAGLGLHWLFIRKGPLIKASIAIFIATPLLLSYFYIFHPTIAQMPFDMHTGYLEEWTAGWGQKQIAQYLISEEGKGKKIVVFTEGFFGTLPDGLQIYTEGHKDITIVGSKPYVDEIPTGLLNTSPENLRFFIVNKSRVHLKPEDLNKLELIMEFPKPARLDGTHESLLFYRLK